MLLFVLQNLPIEDNDEDVSTIRETTIYMTKYINGIAIIDKLYTNRLESLENIYKINYPSKKKQNMDYQIVELYSGQLEVFSILYDLNKLTEIPGVAIPSSFYGNKVWQPQYMWMTWKLCESIWALRWTLGHGDDREESLKSCSSKTSVTPGFSCMIWYFEQALHGIKYIIQFRL